MKSVLFFTWVLYVALQCCGQSPGEIDTSIYQELKSDSLYQVAKRGFLNLEHSPMARLDFVDMGLKRAIEEDNPQFASEFSAHTAVIYTELGLNQQALEFGQQALNYALRTPDKTDDIWALYRLSETHFILKDITQSLDDANQALRLSLELNEPQEIGWSYNCLGEIYRRLPRIDSAIHYYQLGLDAFKQINYDRGLTFLHQNMGNTYVAAGDFEKALEEFKIANDDEDKGDLLFQLEQGRAMVRIIESTQSLDSAIIYGLNMLDQAVAGQYPIWERQFRADLADLYRKQGNWEKAWTFRREADSLAEMQTGEQIRLQSSVTDHQYRLKLLETEQELTTQESQNEILFWISLLVVLGLLGVVATIRISKNNRIRKINDQLSLKNESLDELIQEKDIWINLMAHDLKAPLNSITGLLEMLKQDNLPPALQEKVLNNIGKSVRQGSELISQLLEISRLESGQVEVNIQKTDLKKLVQEIEQVFRPSAEQKAIALETQVPADPLDWPTDPVLLRRILENFVSNALKFSPKGKTVTIALQKEADKASILVRDQGPGLSEKDQENLFQKFRKLSARPTGGETSTGLGLSIVKELANRIDAWVEVQSEAGKGATFILSLPWKDHLPLAKTSQAAETATKPVNTGQQALQPKRR